MINYNTHQENHVIEKMGSVIIRHIKMINSHLKINLYKIFFTFGHLQNN